MLVFIIVSHAPLRIYNTVTVATRKNICAETAKKWEKPCNTNTTQGFPNTATSKLTSY